MRKVATLLTVPTGALHRIAMGTHELVWMRAQVRDNLHQFDDGVYIGRLAASETLSDAPIVHTGSLPRSFDTVSSGVVIRSGPELTVEPLGVTLTFRCSDTISDRQLLLAAHDDLRPSAAGVAVLASIGHFPGDMTLFDEVRRIPLLERWYVTTRRGERTRALSLPKANDDLMIDRLVSLIPTDVPHALGLSGGNDSRFMLGILLRAKADVRLVRFTDFESATALGIADQLGLEVQGIGAPAEQDGQRSWYEFMLLTDAQIWHSVTQHGRLGQNLTAADMFHSGHFSPSMTKNTFKTAWKVPDPRRPFWDRLVHSAFLSNAPAVQPALRAVSRREELEQVVRDELQSQRTYVEFTTRKQWANWLYFANRGVRWSQAFYGDLTFSTNLVFSLSDIDAQLLGISTGFWDNFHNDRVARLNRLLLPEVDVPYHSGRPVDVTTGVRGAWDKLEYEYLERFRTAQSARAMLDANTSTYLEDLPADQPPGYDLLFDRQMAEVATMGKFGLRRASATAAHVLTFLASVPRPTPDEVEPVRS
jgi:hypothetical protein